MKKILVLNSGSSSLKYQLFNVEGENYNVVAKGVADRIGISGSVVEIKKSICIIKLFQKRTVKFTSFAENGTVLSLKYGCFYCIWTLFGQQQRKISV